MPRRTSSAARKASEAVAVSLQQRRRVYIVDHQPISRYVLSQIINSEPDLTVCGVSGGAENLPRAVRTLKPDIVIIEIAGNSGDGLEALRAIRDADLRVPVLVFSGGDCEDYAIAAMRAGANGYVCKNEKKSTLLRTVRHLLRGGARLCREMTGRLVRDLSFGFADSRPLPIAMLTTREVSVFKLLAGGLNPLQIARRTKLNPAAIQACRLRLKNKLGLASVQELRCAATRWMANNAARAS